MIRPKLAGGLMVTAAVASAVLLLVAGCSASPATRDEEVAPTSSSHARAADETQPAPSRPPVRIVVYGDSNSTGFRGTLESGIAQGIAWAAHLPPGRFTTVGGWAVDGATTTAMADAAIAVEADVLVIMGGTNDLAQGMSAEEVQQNLSRIADEVGVRHVALAAVAPSDYLPRETLALNESLEAFADSQGWSWLDPWVDLRTPEGTWVGQYATDGIHTSPEGYERAANEIAEQLQEPRRP